MTPLDKILDPPEKLMFAKLFIRTPPKTQVKANDNLKEVKRRIREQNLNPFKHLFISHVDARRPNFMLNKTMTLTATMCSNGGPWSVPYGRRMHITEMIKLQGGMVKEVLAAAEASGLSERAFLSCFRRQLS